METLSGRAPADQHKHKTRAKFGSDAHLAVSLDAQLEFVVRVQSVQFVSGIAHLLGDRAEELRAFRRRRRGADGLQQAHRFRQPEPMSCA